MPETESELVARLLLVRSDPLVSHVDYDDDAITIHLTDGRKLIASTARKPAETPKLSVAPGERGTVPAFSASLSKAARGEYVFRTLIDFAALKAVTPADIEAWAADPDVRKALGDPLKRLQNAYDEFDRAEAFVLTTLNESVGGHSDEYLAPYKD